MLVPGGKKKDSEFRQWLIKPRVLNNYQHIWLIETGFVNEAFKQCGA